MNMNFQLGITRPFPCNYLPNKQERLLVATDPRLQDGQHYDWLMSQGFRRSGDQIYRPHCENCQACQSLRVLTNDFKASKSQKRLINKNKHLVTNISHVLKEEYYPIYERYINEIHHDGAMFPANYEQYKSFLNSKITKQLFVELLDDDNIVAVAVTDLLDSALSAVYTFYLPEYKNVGIGVYSILNQIDLAKKMNKEFVYLGYQIDDCRKMNYKDRYHPHQRLVENSWIIVNK